MEIIGKIIGWVLHAGAKVLGSLIPFSRWVSQDTLDGLAMGSLNGSATLGLICALVIALAYGTVAGLRGVVWTDLLQFTLAMVGAIALAVAAYQVAGGSAGVAMLIDGRAQGLLPADLEILTAMQPTSDSELTGLTLLGLVHGLTSLVKT